MIYIWAWLISGLLGYIIGMISDCILYEGKMKIDIEITLLSLFLGPVIWVLIIISIVEHKGWKQRRKDKKNAK